MGDTVIKAKPANSKRDAWAERIATQQRSGMSVKLLRMSHGVKHSYTRTLAGR